MAECARTRCCFEGVHISGLRSTVGAAENKGYQDPPRTGADAGGWTCVWVWHEGPGDPEHEGVMANRGNTKDQGMHLSSDFLKEAG